jgi:DNA-binding NtrC family response regulator
MSAHVLLIEDDPLIRRSLASRLRTDGHKVTEAAGVAEARKRMGAMEVDLALVDFQLPDGTGFDVMEALQLAHAGVPAVMLTAHASIDHAVEAMRRGAFTYLQKPVDPDELEVQVRKALQTRDLQRENRRLKRLRQPTATADQFLGESSISRALRDTIRQVARSPARTVLLQGESGTGKGLVARILHGESPRSEASFVSVTCSAVPETLLESELFGHEAGAFTDARRRKIGLLEAADGGTVFLDEIGDMPTTLQAKLLGVLEERSFRRVGGVSEIRVDTRTISATHRDLDKLVEEGRFREDLLYRLRVIPIRIPPLRERPEDIPVLAQAFANELAAGWGRAAPTINDESLAALMARPWPGNVRELRNAVERAIILSPSDRLDLSAFGADTPVQTEQPDFPLPSKGVDVESVIDSLLAQAMRRTHGNQCAAGRLLGLSRDQVRYRLRKREPLRSVARTDA